VAAALALRGLASAALLGTATLVLAQAPAAGGLIVSPTRVVLAGVGPGAKLTVRNTGTRVTTYRLSLVRMRMGERGEMSLVDEPRTGELFAEGLVRFSPVELHLAPGVDQAVRLKARPPRGVAAGEYRSHLLFRPVEEPAAADEPAGEVAGSSVGARPGPLVGITVPVIVRVGDVKATVRISSLRIVRTGEDERLEVAVERSGSASTYGDLVVSLEADGTRPERVGGLGGVAVYAPNERRVVEIPLRLLESTPAGERRLRVEYRSAGEDGKLLAERATVIPPR
jgi:hypothetical protein